MATEPCKRRALVVDDDQPIRFMLRRILERENCDVEMARDGGEAIELLKKDAGYDLVLLDLMLPRVDGYGVLRHLRNTDPARLQRVIVMTAGATTEIREPVRAVLTKPFDMEELRRHARELCQNYDHEREQVS